MHPGSFFCMLVMLTRKWRVLLNWAGKCFSIGISPEAENKIPVSLPRICSGECKNLPGGFQDKTRIKLE
jgi:hypothetical protein